MSSDAAIQKSGKRALEAEVGGRREACSAPCVTVRGSAAGCRIHAAVPGLK